jgi:hypothetical protein
MIYILRKIFWACNILRVRLAKLSENIEEVKLRAPVRK